MHIDERQRRQPRFQLLRPCPCRTLNLSAYEVNSIQQLALLLPAPNVTADRVFTASNSNSYKLRLQHVRQFDQVIKSSRFAYQIPSPASSNASVPAPLQTPTSQNRSRCAVFSCESPADWLTNPTLSFNLLHVCYCLQTFI